MSEVTLPTTLPALFGVLALPPPTTQITKSRNHSAAAGIGLSGGNMKVLTQLVPVAALLASTTLAAQAQESLTLDKKVLTLAAARKVIGAAEAEARARTLGVVIVVVDDAGNVIQLSRMDAAQVASVNVGIGKARTAAIYRRPSRVFEEQIRNGRVAALALADATPLQGGVPIVIDGKVVGAVGVSGDSPQADEEIAMAGARALEQPAQGSVSRR